MGSYTTLLPPVDPQITPMVNRENSFHKKLFDSRVIIIMNQDGKIEISKCWSGEKDISDLETLEILQQLISKSILRSDNEMLKVFRYAIENEVVESINKIFRKYRMEDHAPI